jgi:hypothetical protein
MNNLEAIVLFVSLIERIGMFAQFSTSKYKHIFRLSLINILKIINLDVQSSEFTWKCHQAGKSIYDLSFFSPLDNMFFLLPLSI